MKTVSFDVRSRGVTLPSPVGSAKELYLTARQLLGAEIKACSPAPLQLRLMGEIDARTCIYMWNVYVHVHVPVLLTVLAVQHLRPMYYVLFTLHL